MKSKKIVTILLVIVSQVFYAQEVKKEQIEENSTIVKDSISSVATENQNIIKKDKPTTPDSETIAALRAEQKAKKEAEKLLKEEQKAKKEVENRQKEIAENQKKLEKQQGRIEKEQKQQIKRQKNINEAEQAINKANDNLNDAQKDIVKDAEKHNKKLEKGKLSPVDIEKYEKEKMKQEQKIEDLKTKILKAETKLRKAKK